MRGTSAASLEAARERIEPMLAGTAGKEMGSAMFTVVDTLDSSASLSRALTDPARDEDGKADLVIALFGGKVDERVVDFVAGMARSRWSDDADLADALEEIAIDAMLAYAQEAGELEQVEDDVFRLDRLLVGQRELRNALVDPKRSAADRSKLATELLGGRMSPAGLELVLRVTTAPRGRRLGQSLSLIGRRAAARRNRILAQVTAAVPLTRAQQDRLAGILERAYGRPVSLNIGVDPAVMGGVRVAIGSDVIDGTVQARVAEVQRRIAAD